jgi:hypothetical protein
MYYRRDINILKGGPDDPTQVWQEFARVRNHLMSIDQNNVRGVRSDRIVSADDPGHEGISDIRTADTPEMQSLGYFPYREDSVNTSIEFVPGNGVWTRLSDDFYLDMHSKWEADWIVGGGIEVEVSNPSSTADRVYVELAIHSSSSQGSTSNASTMLPGSSAISNVCPLRIPAGPFRVYPLVRATWPNPPSWSSATAARDQVVTIKKANLYAFGLYR